MLVVSAISVPSPGMREARIRRMWRVLVDEVLRAKARRPERVGTGCFGRLVAKDEMVVKGLAAGSFCSPEEGRAPW
jgi:hypothetical protein